jgi:ribose transport system substrate-binding protein
MKMQHRTRLFSILTLLLVIALLSSACVAPAPAGGGATSGGEVSSSGTTTETASSGSSAAPAKTSGFVVGVSNTLVGNGWREQMICAIKAEAKASGVVDKVIVVNRNGGPTEQLADLEGLISQGVDAIILNPTDREGLNDVLEEAIKQGIVVVAIDQAVTADGAYVVTNDQKAYAKIGAEWLFKQLNGKGDVAEMRGIDGVPADTDRHAGFEEALKEYPGINVVSSTFTNWDLTTTAQQALDLISTKHVDGIWTSGGDYPVVQQFQSAGKPFVPIVGADNNGFIGDLINLKDKGLVGAAVTNPPAIGGVGMSVAIDALTGKNPEHQILLTPQLFATGDVTLTQIYAPDQQVGWSTYVDIPPYTHYHGSADVAACKGPGE